jgi:5'-nucleotidase (lipoprotein e(P4) family)
MRLRPDLRASALCAVIAVLAAGCTPRDGQPVALSEALATKVPPEMQYLYGSGESAAISEQSWRALMLHVVALVVERPKDSVVLATASTLAEPKWVPCGDKPFAVIVDVDETVLLNTGYEYYAAQGNAYSSESWDEWERTGSAQVIAVPGAKRATAALRSIGVTVVFNSNRNAANADQTAAAIAHAGLGDAVHGETLFLSGDDDTGSHKDARRAVIAARYCVLAMAGDQLGDFSDLFNAGLTVPGRRAATAASPVVHKWGAGWFLLPNPVYGSALKGGFDDVFPNELRWSPAPEEE